MEGVVCAGIAVGARFFRLDPDRAEAMQRTRPRAFTLIELMVVVAVIGLLISIVVPSLNRAREQARISKCLSNLRSIAQAASGYLTQDNTLVFTWPLFYKRDEGRRYGLYTEFIWGGGVPDRKSDDWDPALGENPVNHRAWEGGSGADVYWFYPEERPLNGFIAPNWEDDRRSRISPEQNVNRRLIPMDLADVFRCPSDSSAATPYSGAGPEDGGSLRTWEFWGTSYPINWHWGWYHTDSRSDKIFDVVAGDARKGTRGIGAEFLASKMDRGAAEFALFFENRLNQALEHARPRGADYPTPDYIGWHGQSNQHVAAFLDGHAAYKLFNTRYIEGPGWTVWPNRPWSDSAMRWMGLEDN